MDTDKRPTYVDVVAACSSLPEHVLQAYILMKAWEDSAKTDEESCEFCNYVMGGAEGDNPGQCHHYDYLEKALKNSRGVEEQLTPEERELARQVERVERDVPFEKRHPRYYDLPTWEDIPEGYYAVPDPRSGVAEMTYWRRKDKGKNKRPTFEPWPRPARYAPVLYKKEIPSDIGDLPEREYVLAWYGVVNAPYRDAIIEAILEDPMAAAQRFAKWQIRCCICGKKLTHEKSKVVGIGPECGKGVPEEVLANRFRPRVGQAHAETAKEAG